MLSSCLSDPDTRERILSYIPSETDVVTLQNRLAQEGLLLSRKELGRTLFSSTRSQREAGLRLLEQEGLVGLKTRILQVLTDVQARATSEIEVDPKVKLAATTPEDTLCNWLEISAAVHGVGCVITGGLWCLAGAILYVYSATCNLVW